MVQADDGTQLASGTPSVFHMARGYIFSFLALIFFAIVLGYEHLVRDNVMLMHPPVVYSLLGVAIIFVVIACASFLLGYHRRAQENVLGYTTSFTQARKKPELVVRNPRTFAVMGEASGSPSSTESN